MSFRSVRGAFLSSLVGLFLVSGCGGDGDGPMNPDPDPDPTPTISISVSPATLTLDQGTAVSEQPAPTTGTVTVTLTRGGGYTGAVTAGIEGAPTGVSASPVTIPAGSTSGTLTIEVTSAAVPGTNTITVRGTGSGVTDATTTFSLTVDALPTPEFSISVDPTSVSIQQGAGISTALSVTRSGGFTGAVTLAASGQPGGLTVSFDPSTGSGDVSTVTVTAAGSLAAGTYPVTITGSATGLSEATTSLSVEVTASSGSGQTVTLNYCELSGIPDWVAFQDGDGPWVPITPVLPTFGGFAQAASATYEFDISTGRGGIATIEEDGGSANMQIFFGTAEQLGFLSGGECAGTGFAKTVSGSVAGVGATDQAYISLGGASTSIQGVTGVFNWTLQNVPDGPVDLLASVGTLTIGGTGFTFDLTKMVIERGLNPADNANIGVVDFNGSNAFAPVMRDVTVNNLGTDAYVLNMAYNTANGSSGLFFTNFQPSTDPMGSYPGIPAAQQEAADFHLLTVLATDPNLMTLDHQRSVTLINHDAKDLTATLGPELNLPTITQPATMPYVRFRAQVAVQDEYDGYTFVTFNQTAGRMNSVLIGTTESFRAGSDLDVTIPDFSGLAGFDDNWGPEAGVPTTWGLLGIGWTGMGGIIGTPYFDGAVSFSAGRFGEITP